MELGLSGRLVLVTGGSRGIGRATAEAFGAEGAIVVITYRDDEVAAKAVAARLGTGVPPVRYAMEEAGASDRLLETVTGQWGSVDVLVANALSRPPRRSPLIHFEDVPPREWTATITANLFSTMRLAQLVSAGMRQRSWGRMAFISSHVVRDGQAGQEFYAAGKGALHALVRSLAWDAADGGVLANVVCPGLTTTEGVRTALPAPVRQRELERTPTGRLSTPQDIANAVVFLCSEANGNITGSALTVAGGR